jgi:LSD1 subclass zinc finger protein
MGIVNTIGGLLYCISIPPCVPLYEVGKRFGGFLGLREKVFLEKKTWRMFPLCIHTCCMMISHTIIFVFSTSFSLNLFVHSAVSSIAHVNCGQCQTVLMYPYGAPSVKCAICNFITNVGGVCEFPLWVCLCCKWSKCLVTPT